MTAFLLMASLYLPWIVFLGVVAASSAPIPSGPMLTSKPLDFFKPDPNQPRKVFDQAAEVLLGASLKKKQLVPVLARSDGTIIDGERRWRAAKAAGLTTLDVIITEENLSQSQMKQMQLITAMQRTDLSGWEKFLGCSELMCMNAGWQMKDLAEHLHLDPSMVTRLLSPSKCIEAWQNALRDGKVGISDCYCASKLPEAEQAGLLALKLSGASRDTIEATARKSRSSGTPMVKVTRVKCPLPTGTVVVVSGPEMSLDDLIEALGQALDAAKKANRDGLDVKTMQAVMKDKAKAVG
jgi:ParB family transcriptional regulator, chromosome partitioning protein